MEGLNPLTPPLGTPVQDDIDSRQANKPSCWTSKLFDVRTGAVDV